MIEIYESMAFIQDKLGDEWSGVGFILSDAGFEVYAAYIHEGRKIVYSEWYTKQDAYLAYGRSIENAFIDKAKKSREHHSA